MWHKLCAWTSTSLRSVPIFLLVRDYSCRLRTQRNFLLTLIISSAIGFAFFGGVMLYARAKKLLFTPEAGLQ